MGFTYFISGRASRIVQGRRLHSTPMQRVVRRDGLHGASLRGRPLERRLVCKGVGHGGVKCLVVGALSLRVANLRVLHVCLTLGWVIAGYGAVTIVVVRRRRVESGADGRERWVV